MGYTEKYLQRANIQFIQEFLKHGTCCMKLEKGSYDYRVYRLQEKHSLPG